jgi:hypothetical protein
MAERIILGRLELMLYLALDNNVQSWDWKSILQMLAIPSLLSQFADVRSAASNLISVFASQIGDQVKSELVV